MIVRDEAAVVTETLDSVVGHCDTWVIVDTGSTDDTIELIRAYFLRKGIPGELHERPWHDFGTNRTEALQLAAGKADYTWVIDADDLLVGSVDLSRLDADAYQLRYGTGSTWWRRQLFRSGLPWRYEGVVHEYATCEKAQTEERLEGDYHVEPRHLGARSADPAKYARDAELLMREHERDPDDARTVFYLAQSHFSAGETARALEWYERRARMGGFAEEVYYSLLRRALGLKALERPLAEIAEAFLEAWQARPTRAEPLCELATVYRLAEKFDLAYMFAVQAGEIPLPSADVLFVDAAVYAWRARDERSIAAYYVGRYQESYDLCTELLEGGRLPAGERGRVVENRAFAAAKLVTRVRVSGNWATSTEICAQWDKQSEGGGRWGSLLVTDDEDADLVAVVNHPLDAGETVDPARTIVFQMEPSSTVAHWGSWSAPDPSEFLQVRDHAHFPNNVEWQLSLGYEQLKTLEIKKTKALSTVTSGLDALPGQQMRVAFIRHLQECGTDIDVFGRDTRPLERKDEGLLPYRYTFAAENSSEPNYFTEKIADAILAECLCFYWGCPNLGDYLPADAFIPLPLDDFERSREAIERAIADGEWERRLPAIREAKRRLLDELQFFPTLERVVRGHRAADELAVRVINLDRRPERWETFRRRAVSAAGERFLDRCRRVSAVDGSLLTPTPELLRLFRENTFGLRRGVVGCALSHLGVWREIADGAAPGCLVLEDDARLCDGFWGQLVEVCSRLEPVDIAILGYEPWSTERELERHDRSTPPRLTQMDWNDYLGGSSGYIVTREGAGRLVDLVERDGFQHPVDVFLAQKRDELRVVECTPPIVIAPVSLSFGSGVATDIQHDFEPVGSTTPPASSGALGWQGPPSPVMRHRGELALKSLAPSLELGEVFLDVRPAWPLSDPTVAAGDDGVRMIVRSSGEGQTLHYTVRLDDALGLVDARPLEGAAGYEDCRLLNVGGSWLVCARDAEGRVLLTLDDATAGHALRLPSGAVGAPFVVEGEVRFLDGGSLPFAVETQGVAVDGGTLFVAHEEIAAEGVTRHAHRFVRLDDEFRPAAASPRFRLAGEQAELCTGLTRLGGRLVLSFGIDNRAVGLAVVDEDEALELLSPL
jgi:GR25 family glycosyltransferase involved in LPS biosynthesis